MSWSFQETVLLLRIIRNNPCSCLKDCNACLVTHDRFGKFERRLQLPAIRLKQDQVSAKMTDGVLEVVIGKESDTGKTIHIQ
jgi:HSP20 family molecular chaperone IbpA